MINPTLIPFKAEHWMSFFVLGSTYQDEFRQALHKERGGPAFTAILEAEIIACAGIIVHHKGMGYAWSILNSKLQTYYSKRVMVWITRTVDTMLRDIKRSFNLHRIELIVDANQLSHQEWAERLGFTMENGRARMFTEDKRDIIRYEMITK